MKARASGLNEDDNNDDGGGDDNVSCFLFKRCYYNRHFN